MAIEVVALLFALRVTYENNVQRSEKQIRNAADVTVQFCESYNLYNQSDEKTISETMLTQIPMIIAVLIFLLLFTMFSSLIPETLSYIHFDNVKCCKNTAKTIPSDVSIIR